LKKNTKLIAARRTRDPKRRLLQVWAIAKTKSVCEGGEDMDVDKPDDADGAAFGEDEDGKKKKSHGGCGHKQPTIRKDGLKLYATFKSNSGEVC
jgi:DNA-directed RNA polymerase II subunit RPB1